MNFDVSQKYLLSSGLYRRHRNLTCSALSSSRAFTAGMEFHHSPKIFLFHWKSAPRILLFSVLMKINATYARMLDTTPEPTVLPPSRIAKRRPSSQAMGVMSSTVISTLSPGRHISTPAGSSMIPVTSVVLK